MSFEIQKEVFKSLSNEERTVLLHEMTKIPKDNPSYQNILWMTSISIFFQDPKSLLYEKLIDFLFKEVNFVNLCVDGKANIYMTERYWHIEDVNPPRENAEKLVFEGMFKISKKIGKWVLIQLFFKNKLLSDIFTELGEDINECCLDDFHNEFCEEVLDTYIVDYVYPLKKKGFDLSMDDAYRFNHLLWKIQDRILYKTLTEILPIGEDIVIPEIYHRIL